MSYLFKIIGKRVKPNSETLLIPPYNEIWERDESPDKDVAIAELTYIEFMASKKKSNPYKGYSQEKRHEMIVRDNKEELFDWIPDRLIAEGIEKINEFQKEASEAYKYLSEFRKTVINTREFISKIDLNKTTKSGTPVYKIKDVITGLSGIDSVLAKIDELEKKLEEDIDSEIESRNGRVFTPFSDPSFLIESMS